MPRSKYGHYIPSMHATSADVPRTVVTPPPRSQPRSVAARRLVRMRRRKKSRSRLRPLLLRRPGRAKLRSRPTTTKMLRLSKLPKERDEARRPSQSRRLMRKPSSKPRLPRRSAGPRRPKQSLKSMMSAPSSSPRREAVLRRPRLSPRPTRKLPRIPSPSPSPSPSSSPWPRRAAERRRLLPTAMTIRPRLPRSLLPSGAVPRRGEHESCLSCENTILTTAAPKFDWTSSTRTCLEPSKGTTSPSEPVITNSCTDHHTPRS